MKHFFLGLLFIGVTGTYAQSYPEMITVEGGTFTMGDTEMTGKKDEQPAHQVTLESYKMAKTETTVAQWRVYCNASNRGMPEAPKWGWVESHPIVNISWEEAKAYCGWLTKIMNAKYRLPTEAEWEFAARGGKLSKGTKFSGDISIDNAGWYGVNSDSKTHEAASKKSNELGIYDMSGNVWEWCGDLYGPYEGTSQTNPQGPVSGSYRVMRGGGWSGMASFCSVADRLYIGPTGRSMSLGFRVVLSK